MEQKNMINLIFSNDLELMCYTWVNPDFD